MSIGPRSLSVVLEEEVVVSLTPPRTSLDPFSLSAAESERQREEVERNQALIYEMLGGRKGDEPDTAPYEEPRSPASLLEDLTASLKPVAEDDKKKDDENEKEKERKEAEAEVKQRPPPMLSRQDTPLPGVISRASDEAREKLAEEEKQKTLPPVHSRPGEGLRARPPSESVSPRQLPKKEDKREEKLKSMMEAAKQKEEEKKSAVAVPEAKPPSPEKLAGDSNAARAGEAVEAGRASSEARRETEQDLDALLSDDLAAQREREAKEMAAIEEEERQMKALEDALAAQEAEHAADVERRVKSEEEAKTAKLKEAEERRAKDAASAATAAENDATPPANGNNSVESAANEVLRLVFLFFLFSLFFFFQAIAELDDLLNRAEAQQKEVGKEKDSKERTGNVPQSGSGGGGASSGSGEADELFEVEVPPETPEETGPKEENAESLEELLRAQPPVVREKLRGLLVDG